MIGLAMDDTDPKKGGLKKARPIRFDSKFADTFVDATGSRVSARDPIGSAGYY
jgi:hypothetical protein